MVNLVLVRHGQSQWNKENKFTGWMDIDLSSAGKQEARSAGSLLKEKDFKFDMAFTSVLKRAVCTLWMMLEELDQVWIPVEKSWRLNERHYGPLTGLNKKALIKKYGEQQVHLWRRSYTASPPCLEEQPIGGFSQIRNKTFFSALSCCDEEIVKGESLKQTKNRVLPFWKESIFPELKKGKNLLIVAHGNSLRAMIKHIENLSSDQIVNLEISTATPLVYHFHIKGSYFKKIDL